MTDRPIPESIMREAEFAYDVAFDLGPEVIARALMARDERAARIAREKFDLRHHKWARYAGLAIASAILSEGE